MSAGVIRRLAVRLLFTVALVVAAASAAAMVTNRDRATAASPSIPLYVANSFNNTITSYDQASPGPPLATIGDPSLLDLEENEAFDSAGDLWVSSDDLLGGAGTIVEYTPGQLSSTGAPVPHVVLTGFAEPLGIAFDAAGDLWVSDDYGEEVFMIPPSELGASGTPTPTVTLSLQNAPGGLAFDASGDLWVAEQEEGNSELAEFSPGQLTTSGSPSPSLTLSGSGLTAPKDIRFDSGGNLWVDNSCFGCSVVEFSVSQLATSGSPAPVTALTPTGSEGGPTDLAFDASGDLWVSFVIAESGSSAGIVEYTPGQLTGSANPAPTVTLLESGEPSSLTFDSSGGLWVANSDFSDPQVVEYAPSELGTSGDPTPGVVVSASAQTLSVPEGMAVDQSGDLWVVNAGDGSVVEYSAAQLGASGNPTPVETITGLDAPLSVAFDANGDLWVSNCGGDCDGTGTADGSIAEFTPSQLTAGGDVAPSVSITGLGQPGALAFDGSGDLWVSGCGGQGCSSGSVSEYAPSQLASSGSPTLDVTISGSNEFDDLAFDASGDLWIVSEDNDIVEYTPSQLTANGSPSPNVTITPDSSLTGQLLEIFPIALAFDSAGDLWLTGSPSALVEYTPSQLSSSGSPTPAFEEPAEGSGLSGPIGIATAPITIAGTTTTSTTTSTTTTTTGGGATTTTTPGAGGATSGTTTTTTGGGGTTTTTGSSTTSTTSAAGAILTSSGTGTGTGVGDTGASTPSAALAVTGAGAVAPVTLIGALFVMIGIIGRRMVLYRRRTVTSS
jgi:sugar lactone lactonase YvrE